jgi:hypothetical protein
VERVSRDSINQQPLATIPVAMKQFWIIKAVFAACDQLKLDGLQTIDFPERPREGQDTKSASESALDYSLIPVDIQIDLRYSDAKRFIAELFKDSQVPFLTLDSVKLAKTPDVLRQFATLVRSGALSATEDEARKKAYDDVVPEPKVAATISLRVLDWVKMKEPVAPKAEEPEPSKKPGKDAKKTKRKR